MLLQPTSPFTRPEDIVAALDLFEAGKRQEMVVSVTKSKPLGLNFNQSAEGHLEALDAGAMPTRRQEDPRPVVRLNGAIYVAEPGMLAEHKAFVKPGVFKTRPLEIAEQFAADIDYPADLLAARGLAMATAEAASAIEFPGVNGTTTVRVGPGEPCFIIAEAGVNHNGDVAIARELIDIAKEAGADAVKFQTFRADKLLEKAAPKANYQLETTDKVRTAPLCIFRVRVGLLTPFISLSVFLYFSLSPSTQGESQMRGQSIC